MIPLAVPHGVHDFETYSEAGQVWDDVAQKWRGPPGAPKGKRGLFVVNAAAYTEHPSTEVLTYSYRLPGRATARWRPGMPNPQDLFDYLAAGGLLESHNAMFERLVWENVCVPKYGWPSLTPFQYQLRCSMATAHVNCLPGALALLSTVLKLPTPKDAEGKRLLDKFSVPRKPTTRDPRWRILPHEEPEDFEKLQEYCDTDLEAETGASERMYPMTPDELFFWWIDQEINWRGVGIDRPAVRDCIAILGQALTRYGDEFRQITGGLDPTQLQAVQGWLSAKGVYTASMDEEARGSLLKHASLLPHPPGGQNPMRRVVEILNLIGSASVKKLYAMENQACRDDTLRNLIIHHGARTGRPTGEGPQPLNLPKAGPDLKWCGSLPKGEWRPDACRRPFAPSHKVCPWCMADNAETKVVKWSAEAVDHVLEIMAHRSLDLVEWFFGDALKCISGCVRGLFVARPGHDLIASDYSAIEAVVIAKLAGEQWRIDAFERNEPIYLVGAAKITGKTLEYYQTYKEERGDHHPDRQYVGKVSELALGFGGWINAWRAMEEQQKKDNPDFVSPFGDDDIKRLILGWRGASPAIVEMWGGQHRGLPWDPNRYPELYGVEGAAVAALQFPGQVFDFRGIKFQLRDHVPDVVEQVWEVDPFLYGDNERHLTERVVKKGEKGHLFIRLLSGRELIYRDAALAPSARQADEKVIIYWTWNSNPQYGAIGWVPMQTFGGRLTENIVQATAHDILRHAIIQLRAAGYATVLHVYDEIVCEIPQGTGSLEEFERIMSTMPPWAHDWPVRASGGWRGRRYRKG